MRAKKEIIKVLTKNDILMNIETAKQINLADYLHSLGYSPVKQQGINLWYKSPLREETEASFKVNTERNQWYDFGLGKGAVSLNWLHTCMLPTMYLTCWSRLRNRHRMYTRYLFLLASKALPSRASNSWK